METVKSRKPHVLAVPFPAQGHVKPLMKLCRRIAKQGIKVTFVNIESIHAKIAAAASAAKMSVEEEEEVEENIEVVSVSDGRNPEDGEIHAFKLLDILRKSMPQSLPNLIEMINSSNPDENITCVVADITIGWILEIVEKIGVEAIGFLPASAAAVALASHIQMLLDNGNLDSNGTVKKVEQIILSDDLPAWPKDEVTWCFSGDLETQKIFFECCEDIGRAAKQAKFLLSNTSYELESPACDLIPNLLPIGPLLETDTPNSSYTSYNFYSEDPSSLSWLDTKSPGSLIYISFGSLAVFSQQQFDELALGLELSGRDFLWVVRLDLANGSRAVYPDGFLDRVSKLGKIVEWAPQEKVLSHSPVACFLSHCGWNSTFEGLCMGVPFLCWPSFGDQFHNQNYISDKWEIGLRIDPDENGIRSRHEIKKKIDMMFSYDNLKANALKLKELSRKSVSDGGSSYKNFATFIDYLRK